MRFQYSDWSCYRTRIPVLVAVDKKERSCKITDFAIAGNSKIQKKEKDRKISRVAKGVTEGMKC